jgi:hypothetical protein
VALQKSQKPLRGVVVREAKAVLHFGTCFASAPDMKLFPTAVTGVVVSLCLWGCAQNKKSLLPSADNQTGNSATVTTSPSEPVRGFARGVHLVPGLGPIALRSGQQTFANGVSFGIAAPYEGIKEVAKSTTLNIEAVEAGNVKVAGPMAVKLEPGEDLTVFATGVPGDVALLPFKPRNFGVQRGQAKVAFIHAAKALPAVEIRVDGKRFRRSVKYGVASSYTVLAPGRHLMEIAYDKSLPPTVVQVEQPTVITQDEMGNVLDVKQPPPTTTVIPQKAMVTLKQEMDLMANKVYEVVLFHGPNKVPHLRLLEDRFADDLAKSKPAEY